MTKSNCTIKLNLRDILGLTRSDLPVVTELTNICCMAVAAPQPGRRPGGYRGPHGSARTSGPSPAGEGEAGEEVERRLGPESDSVLFSTFLSV